MQCKRTRPTAEERFWAKVEKTDTCWLWRGSTTSGGYGHFYFERRTALAHRVSYLWAKGPVPDGLQLDHLCRVRNCVNPDHLEAVTASENCRRGTGPMNSVKEVCFAGHPMEGDNIYVYPDGVKRECWTCKKARQRAWKRRNRFLSPDNPEGNA